MKNALRLICLAVVFGALIAVCSPVFALSYQYDLNNAAVAAPDGYDCARQFRTEQIGKNESWAPTDLFAGRDGTIYVLDSMNGAVHLLDKQLNLLRKVTFKQDGNEAFLMNVSGFFVDDSGADMAYYVADPDNERVVIADKDGNITREITKPDTELIDKDASFKPGKVLLDSNRNLYMLVPNIYMGACVFSGKDDFSFMTFLGSNPIEVNSSVAADYFWKQILNNIQISGMKRYIPQSFTNFTLDKDGYLYTVTDKTTLGTDFKNQIKKFNTNNINIQTQRDYGDTEVGKVNSQLQITAYSDIAVNGEGYLFALDSKQCRIAVFTADGDRLFTFGDSSNMVGGFDTPVAIDVLGNDIYVLDQYNETVSLFKPTDYGKKVFAATKLYANGNYKDAEANFRDILKQNSAFYFGYLGIGKSLMQQDRFNEALLNFKLANDKTAYSEAYAIVRGEHMQGIFPILFLVCVALAVFLIVLERRFKLKSNYFNNPMHKSLFGKIRYAFFHPSEGGYVLARHTSVHKTTLLSIGVICVWFVASAIDWQYSGFIFNGNNTQNFEVVIHILKTFILFGLWVGAGWCVSNLMDSSARLIDLTVVSAVAMIPYIISIVLHTLLSNVLVETEAGFLMVVQVFLILWAFVILLGGLKEVHELSFKKTLLFILFTVIGMALIVFMLLLLWSLLQHMASFASQVWTEFNKM